MCQFKVWDKVKYITWVHSYTITEIRWAFAIIEKCDVRYKTLLEKLELISDVPIVPVHLDTLIPNVPVNSNNNSNNNNFMKYFHTAVLVKELDSTTCTPEYVELVPYAVRNALNESDMRDTLVRELKKSIKTSDCKFLISPIF